MEAGGGEIGSVGLEPGSNGFDAVRIAVGVRLSNLRKRFIRGVANINPIESGQVAGRADEPTPHRIIEIIFNGIGSKLRAATI